MWPRVEPLRAAQAAGRGGTRGQQPPTLPPRTGPRKPTCRRHDVRLPPRTRQTRQPRPSGPHRLLHHPDQHSRRAGLARPYAPSRRRNRNPSAIRRQEPFYRTPAGTVAAPAPLPQRDRCEPGVTGRHDPRQRRRDRVRQDGLENVREVRQRQHHIQGYVEHTRPLWVRTAHWSRRGSARPASAGEPALRGRRCVQVCWRALNARSLFRGLAVRGGSALFCGTGFPACGLPMSRLHRPAICWGPGGTCENSPAIDRWDGRAPSLGGPGPGFGGQEPAETRAGGRVRCARDPTLKRGAILARPSGTKPPHPRIGWREQTPTDG
jgi:hypothetical protein